MKWRWKKLIKFMCIFIWRKNFDEVRDMGGGGMRFVGGGRVGIIRVIMFDCVGECSYIWKF